MDILIYGAGYQGAVAWASLRSHPQQTAVGFIDDDEQKKGQSLQGLPILPYSEWIKRYPDKDFAVFVAIGNPVVRCRLSLEMKKQGRRLINIIHRSAVIMEDVSLGSNILICAGAVVVTGSQLADNVVVNTSASVDHNSCLLEGAYLAPGVHTAGCVTVGRQAFIGIGALLGPNVTIGEGAIIGAGSVVLNDIPPRQFACGIPARVKYAIAEPVNWRAIFAKENRP